MAAVGRKRIEPPIKLAAGYSYGGGANRKLIVPQQAPINQGFDGKNEPLSLPYRPHEVTEADIATQIKDTLEVFFAAIEPVRPRGVLVQIEGDPLGLKTGAYARRPKTHPAQPTPERIMRGEEAGEILNRHQPVNDRGEPVGEPVTEMMPALKRLLRQGTIDSNEYEAAITLCKQWHYSKFRGADTVQYKARVDGGGAHVYESERVVYYRQRVYAAIKSVDALLAPALAWVLATMGDPPPLSALGSYYAPGKSLQIQSNRGSSALSFALASLCRHYGISHRLTDMSRNQVVGEVMAMIC